MLRIVRLGTLVAIGISVVGILIALGIEDEKTKGNPEAWVAVGSIAFGIVIATIINNWQLREDTRPCPRCGERVAVGQLDCPHCDFDFRTIGS